MRKEHCKADQVLRLLREGLPGQTENASSVL